MGDKGEIRLMIILDILSGISYQWLITFKKVEMNLFSSIFTSKQYNTLEVH